MSKVWFVTGANSGIGAGIVNAALAAGNRVVAKGKRFDEATFRTAAAAAVKGARSSGHNAFKIELTPKVIARALMTAGDMA